MQLNEYFEEFQSYTQTAFCSTAANFEKTNPNGRMYIQLQAECCYKLLPGPPHVQASQAWRKNKMDESKHEIHSQVDAITAGTASMVNLTAGADSPAWPAQSWTLEP